MDWQSRLDELNLFLRATCEIDDTEAVRILVACLVSCPRTRPPWLILETNWLTRSCHAAWFAFGGEAWRPFSLPELRSMRPRRANETIRQWLEEDPQPHLFVEPDFDRMANWRQFAESRYLLARSLRLRVIAPRSAGVLAADQRELDRRADRLDSLLRSVVEDRANVRSSDPPLFRQPPNFLYRAEILQRLAPWFPDWNELLNSLASLAIHHAHLFGKSEVVEEDWKILSRIARDSVPPWIHRLVRYLSETPAGAHNEPAPLPVQ